MIFHGELTEDDVIKLETKAPLKDINCCMGCPYLGGNVDPLSGYSCVFKKRTSTYPWEYKIDGIDFIQNVWNYAIKTAELYNIYA